MMLMLFTRTLLTWFYKGIASSKRPDSESIYEVFYNGHKNRANVKISKKNLSVVEWQVNCDQETENSRFPLFNRWCTQ